jgi:hypothetical protein
LTNIALHATYFVFILFLSEKKCTVVNRTQSKNQE